MARRTSAGPFRVAAVTTVGLGTLLTVLGGPTPTAPAATPAPGAAPAVAPAVHGPPLPDPPVAAVITPGPPATAAPAPPAAAAPVVAAPAVAAGGGTLPVRVRLAYERAAGAVDPSCGLQWPLLAGIGHVESGHARGGRLDAAGRTTTPIIGLPLDGGPGVRAITDSDGGRYDGDPVWDRAVGPMQFIPGTWATYGADGDGDGRADPHQIDDATLAAARYLCAGGADLGTATGARSAVLRYNLSTSYATRVLLLAQAYRTGQPAGPLPEIGATPNGSAGDGGTTSAPAGPPAVEPPPAGSPVPPPAALLPAPAAVTPPPVVTPPVVTPPVVTPPAATPPPVTTPPVTTPVVTAPPATIPPTPPTSPVVPGTPPPTPSTTSPTATSSEPPPSATAATTGTATPSGSTTTATPTCAPADPAAPAPTTPTCPAP